MAFAGALHANASKSTFNDVGQNQFNVGTIEIGSAACLAPAFSLATFISSMVQQVQSNRQQIAALVASVNTLLKTLDAEYSSGRLLDSKTSVALENLHKYVDKAIRKITAHHSRKWRVVY
jgi:hypothetical protein